jgi:hypothetical protein
MRNFKHLRIFGKDLDMNNENNEAAGRTDLSRKMKRFYHG